MLTAAVVLGVVMGAQVPATSCSRADVGAALNRANDGDEVLIPDGLCTWTTQLTLDKRITLRGAGQDVTTLKDGVSKDAPSPAPLLVLAVAGVRLTGLTVMGVAPDTNGSSVGHVKTFDVRGWRIDHVTFRTPKTNSITASGVGLIDHCLFLYDYTGGVQVRNFVWDGGTFGDSSWASPSTLGTIDAVFVEDCEFTNQNANLGSAVESEFGGRAVVRRNVITQDAVNQIGTDTAQRLRSGRQIEIYENTFVGMPFSFSPINIGGGTGVVFDNVIGDDFIDDVRLDLVRGRGSYVPWGQCDGTSLFDGNVEDAGYPCLDMVGRGSGDLLSGDVPPAAWPNQVLEPLRMWNNQRDGGTRVTNTSPTWIQEGRDYVRGPRVGYAPFPYPHPDNVPDPDAGTGSDAGMPPDAGPTPFDDGGTPDSDAGVRPGLALRVGCACSDVSAGPWVVLCGAALLSRRRRAR